CPASCWRSSLRRSLFLRGVGGGFFPGGSREGLNVWLATAVQQDLDLLLRRLQARLAVARECHATLKPAQRLIQRYVCLLEPLHEALELSERLFEVHGFTVTRHVADHFFVGAGRIRGAQRYTARALRVNARVAPFLSGG